MPELDALESDSRRYLIAAAVIDALELMWVFLVLPSAFWFLFPIEHRTLAVMLAFGWLIVVLVFFIGLPYKCQDRKRGQSLLRQLQDVHAILERHPISPTRLKASLDQASAAGVVFDNTVFALADRLMAGDAATLHPG